MSFLKCRLPPHGTSLQQPAMPSQADLWRQLKMLQQQMAFTDNEVY